MAIELHEGSARVDRNGEVTLTRVFRLNTGNAALRPAWGVAGIAINKYDSHPDDATCLAVDVSSAPVAGELGWFDVTYSYTNRPFDPNSLVSEVAAGGEGGGTEPAAPGASDPTVQPNPTLRPPTIRWGSNARSKPFTRSYGYQFKRADGTVLYEADDIKLVQNSAGQPFEGLETEIHTGTLSISFALPATLDVAEKQLLYLNSVNDANFTLKESWGFYPPKSLKCTAWSGTLAYEAGYGWFTQCEVEIEYKRGGWVRELLDAGYYYKKPTETPGEYVLTKALDPKTGQAVDSPVKLDGLGKLLPPDDPDVYAVFFEYQPWDWTHIFTLEPV